MTEPGIEPLATEPVSIFLTIIAVVLIAPLISERLRIPGIVGLILAGILVGPHGLHILATSHTMELLATVGLIYLMFSAGLEIDLHQFSRIRNKSAVFGVFTFLCPGILGAVLGRLVGLEWIGAVLLGSVIASHTLVAFPIASRLGIVRNEAISITIGATIFTDVAALLLLAIVSAITEGGLSAGYLITFFATMIAYTALVLLGLPRMGKLFFRRFTDPAVEFQFVLVALFVAALGAELIGMHAIIGAFLAGLAINAILPPRSQVIGRILFIGTAFFIPIFQMYIGMMTDPLSIITSVETILIGMGLSVAVYGGKFLAAWLTARIFGYSRDETFVMWGLSQAQAAATLAAILVGMELGIFTPIILNATILMIMCTVITSPLLVQRLGPRVRPVEPEVKHKDLFSRILVPVANPQMQERLIRLASILTQTNQGMLLPIHVAREVRGRVEGLEQQRELLEADIITQIGSDVRVIARVDSSIHKGILRAALEHDASLIILGWKSETTFEQSIFGALQDKVVWGATIPVLVARLTTPINSLQRVVLVVPPGCPIGALSEETLEGIKTIARTLNVPLLVMGAPAELDGLTELIASRGEEYPFDTMPLREKVMQDVARRVRMQDMIVVPASGSRSRFRSSLGDIPEQLVATTPSSVVVIHYP